MNATTAIAHRPAIASPYAPRREGQECGYGCGTFTSQALAMADHVERDHVEPREPACASTGCVCGSFEHDVLP